jgi:sugar O-acyltransferase (sialic acid O-acetyltransferase NeuD family)
MLDTKRIVILGAGGHAQVIADILMQSGTAGARVQPVGFLDDNAALHGELILGLPVLGPIALLTDVPHDAVIIGIGANRTRRALYERLRAAGETFAVAVHPAAVVAAGGRIGGGTSVGARAVISPGSVIGENVILNTGCIVEHHSRIGDHAHIAPGATLGGGVSIGTGTLVGIGATVMPQRTTGNWSTLGAGALLHNDLRDHTIAVGVPARAHKNACT